MKVRRLIEKLKLMDQDAEVYHLWDSEPRTAIERVYMGKTGLCITADFNQGACSNEGRPKNAPTFKQLQYWSTRDKGEER